MFRFLRKEWEKVIFLKSKHYFIWENKKLHTRLAEKTSMMLIKEINVSDIS